MSTDPNLEIAINILGEFFNSLVSLNIVFNFMWLFIGIVLGLYLPLFIDRIKNFINSKNGTAGKKE